jgi:hypothetical protein
MLSGNLASAADVQRLSVLDNEPPGQNISLAVPNIEAYREAAALKPFATPWDNPSSRNMGQSQYVEPRNKIVMTVAGQVHLVRGTGLCWKNTGVRVEICYRDDWTFWGRGYYQPAGYTLFFEKGDCEDRAFAFCSLLRALGYQAMVVECENPDQAHTIVEYFAGGKLWVSDFGCDSKVPEDESYKYKNPLGDITYSKTFMSNNAQERTPYEYGWWKTAHQPFSFFSFNRHCQKNALTRVHAG